MPEIAETEISKSALEDRKDEFQSSNQDDLGKESL